MIVWQRYARAGVALVGVGALWLVYTTIGERRRPAPPAPIERVDPEAAFETTGGEFQRVQGDEQEFDIRADQSLFYKDGSVTQRHVSITARNRGGRDFVVTAGRARSERNEQALQLTEDVTLTASDGFVLNTDRGTFDRATSIADSPGDVTFSKGRLTGSGVGMTYDQRTDVLRVLDRAAVSLANEDGSVGTSFTAAQATLDRLRHVLRLEGDVHVNRDGQTMSGARATAVLSEMLDRVTRIELRGDARVEGGASAASMAARDIDLDYRDDGKTLRTAVLEGGATLQTRRRPDGEDSPVAGDRVAGDRIDLDVGETGELERLRSSGGVRLQQPSTVGSGGRTVTSRTLEASLGPDGSVRGAQFEGNVRYEEAATTAKSRSVSSGRLALTFTGPSVDEAAFAGGVTFRDAPFEARAEIVQYRPMAGSLALRGVDTRGRPRVEDERVGVESDIIDVGLEPRQITARGTVKTTLRAGPSSSGSATAGTRLPGLLSQTDAANVNADTFAYAAETGQVRYTGAATLWQGETTIRGDVLTIDQTNGNVTATGNARSAITLGAERSQARAHEIGYDDTTHVIRYVGAQAPPVAGKAGAPAPAQAGLALLSGPQGELKSRRIEAVLDATARNIERIEAIGEVTSTVDTRAITGDRLTYHAREGRYDVVGRTGAPVKLTEPCRETVGRTLTFFKSADRILVDGGDRARTRTESRTVCAPSPTR